MHIHVITACHNFPSFLKNCHFLFFLPCVCIGTNSLYVSFSSVFQSLVKLKQVQIANNTVKLTASVRWGLLNMVDDHFLWHELYHCCAHSTFAALGIWPIISDNRPMKSHDGEGGGFWLVHKSGLFRLCEQDNYWYLQFTSQEAIIWGMKFIVIIETGAN